MEPGSSIGRTLACLVVALVIGSTLAGVAVATPASAADGDLLDAERTDRTASIDDELNETTDAIENTTDETTDTVQNTTNETTDAIEGTTNETTDAIEGTTNETTDAIEGTTNETTDAIEGTTNETTDAIEGTTNETTDGVQNTTNETADTIEETTNQTTDTVRNTTNETTGELDDPVTNATDDDVATASDELENATAVTTGILDDSVELTTGLVQYTVDETTDAIEYTVSGTTTLVDTIVSETGTLTTVEDGTLGAESSASVETSTDGDSGGADASDDDTGSSDRSNPGARATAADAVLVGLLGAMAATGAATGGTGAGAGGASGTTTTTNPLRRVRRAGSGLPWKLLPIFKYSRYDDSDPLENDRRRTVYEIIQADPGCYLSRIGERSDVSLSTVRHHVRILEDEGLVTTAKVNGKRRYYVDCETSAAAQRNDFAVEDVELHAALDEPAKREVLETLAELGRAHNGRLADAIDRDPSTVSHHLSSLAEDDLVVRERDGRSIANELAPKVEAVLAGEETTEGDASSPTLADD
ncbi:winged helix-turn-helix transcriptional regulator [Halosolutus halophilus]|uniref:winged helix-turn-helix transcriptional regulator n=1 Tax=Halosolutus halophilus TaxID=1552990 RepID=UPI0022350C02|nr:winged helix-turn-helix transcriptional regulator [Halosolutus halophilus]